MKNFIAIMQSTPENRLAKYMDFDTSAEAQAHVDRHVAKYPNAFVQSSIPAHWNDWIVDMTAQTISSFPDYAPTVAEARQRKRREELKKAMEKFTAYRDSSPKITDADLATYKAALVATYDTAETGILAINTGSVAGDVDTIRDFLIAWPDPA